MKRLPLKLYIVFAFSLQDKAIIVLVLFYILDQCYEIWLVFEALRELLIIFQILIVNEAVIEFRRNGIIQF